MAKHKKDPMPNLYAHDKMSFHMLSVCGQCELKDLRSIEGMTKTRANTYIKKGYVERNKVIRQVKVYILLQPKVELL